MWNVRTEQFGVGHTEGVNVMGEVRNRNILIGIVDNDPYALKVFGTLIERMSSDFAVIWTCDLGAVAISRCLSPTKRPDVLVTDMSRRIGPHASSH